MLDLTLSGVVEQVEFIELNGEFVCKFVVKSMEALAFSEGQTFAFYSVVATGKLARVCVKLQEGAIVLVRSGRILSMVADVDSVVAPEIILVADLVEFGPLS